MDRISDVVHDSVSGALQETKSDNEVLSNPSNQPAFSQDTLQKVVRTVGQEEDRANNLMVFGMEESDMKFCMRECRNCLLDLKRSRSSRRAESETRDPELSDQSNSSVVAGLLLQCY